jgi:thiamine biosynthesis protein ThiS
MGEKQADSAVISLVVNEQPFELPAAATVEHLLAALGLQRRGIAVEVNGAIIPHRDLASHRLKAADRVEVVALVGGG